MKKFSIPEGSTSHTEGMRRGEKRKLVAMSAALFIIAGVLIYNTFFAPEEENEFDAELSESPRMQETLVLPEFEPAVIERLVLDGQPVHRVDLERKAVDALLFDARSLTSRHFEALNTQELDSARVAAILADPSAYRTQPFMARGRIEALRSRTNSLTGEVEQIGRLALEDGSAVYFLVLETPPSAGFVRVDGLFLKVFSDEDPVVSGEWIDGPLLIGPRAVRSFPDFGRVDGPHRDLYDSIEDADLFAEPARVVRTTPFEPFWHMMAYARDLEPGAIDWAAAPLLDREMMHEILQHPSEWRGKPIRFPKIRIQDARIRRAGENPARIEKFSEGWAGHWEWPDVMRYHVPFAVEGVARKDLAEARGFFVHNHAYEAKAKGLHVAPVFVLSQLQRWEAPIDPIFGQLAYAFAVVIVGLIGLFVFLLLRDKRRSRRLQEDLIRRKRARRERRSKPPIGSPIS